MKLLYYNPIELPEKIRIKSSCFGIDIEYEPCHNDGKPVCMDDLFYLAKSESFDAIEVYFTSHNEAYVKESKTAHIGKHIFGWVPLSEYGKGGGHFEDKYRSKLID